MYQYDLPFERQQYAVFSEVQRAFHSAGQKDRVKPVKVLSVRVGHPTLTMGTDKAMYATREFESGKEIGNNQI